jgi:hypothetical protein
LIGKTPEEIIQLALQAPEHAASQAGNQNGKGQRAASSEVSDIDAMGRNEFVGLKRALDFGE